jgi:DNA mismatch endonuclease Vsr
MSDLNLNNLGGIWTPIELALRRVGADGFHSTGEAIPGVKPDIYFPKARVSIFVNACQWHGCEKHFTPPPIDVLYWIRKTLEIKDNDRMNDVSLTSAGWLVERIWQCELESLQVDEYANFLWQRVKARLEGQKTSLPGQHSPPPRPLQ